MAKRISSWTTKAVLTALIVVIGLGFGREVIRWWQAERVPLGVGQEGNLAAGSLGDLTQAHDLMFGDQAWAMRRQAVEGSAQAAAEVLRNTCLELTPNSPVPADTLEKAERAFLEKLQARKPIQEAPGKWRVYDLEGGWPIVVGARLLGEQSPATPGQTVAASACRVVTWGLAVPIRDAQWTLYTFYSAGRSAEPGGGFPEMPIPPGSVRLIGARAAGGNGLVAFRGAGPVESWRRFYDRWFPDHGWVLASGWEARGAAWQARWTRQAPPAVSASVQLAPGEAGRLSGLLSVVPQSPEPSGR